MLLLQLRKAMRLVQIGIVLRLVSFFTTLHCFKLNPRMFNTQFESPAKSNHVTKTCGIIIKAEILQLLAREINRAIVSTVNWGR